VQDKRPKVRIATDKKQVLASLDGTPVAIFPIFVSPHLYSRFHPDPFRFGVKEDITKNPP